MTLRVYPTLDTQAWVIETDNDVTFFEINDTDYPETCPDCGHLAIFHGTRNDGLRCCFRTRCGCGLI